MVLSNLPLHHKARYLKAHADHFEKEYRAAWKAGHYCNPVIPKVGKSNGLTTFIVNYLTWKGHRATRINVSGRLIETPEKQASGIILGTKKYMHSMTRKGTADISSTILINGIGQSHMFEVKIGNDRPSPAQLEEQKREQRAGGGYWFVKTTQDFFDIYDRITGG